MGSGICALQSLRELPRLLLQRVTMRRAMTLKASHEERTAADYREPGMHRVVLDRIEQNYRDIRLFKLRPLDDKPKFLPGQWLDVHIPRIPQAGGFTITSTPEDLEQSKPYLELAIQKSLGNPPAAWFWQKVHKIKSKELQIRVGGSFVWPPPGLDVDQVQRVVLVAGGVGINPLISIITHLIVHSDYRGRIELLYSSRKGLSGNITSILFMERIQKLFEMDLTQRRHHYTIFCTDLLVRPSRFQVQKKGSRASLDQAKDKLYVGEHQNIEYRRFDVKDLQAALGPIEERQKVVTYVCGPPLMTDWAVDVLKGSIGMDEKRVLCEKWW